MKLYKSYEYEKSKKENKPFPGNCRCTIIPMDVCDSCGKNPKAPNSQICKECQEKINERYKDWW